MRLSYFSSIKNPIHRHLLFFAALMVIFLYGFVLQVRSIWPFTIDDMYITLRYANQWLSHGNIVWNVDQMPVEGYSNFLFLLIARFSMVMHLDPVWVLKFLGVCGLLGVGIGVYFLTSMHTHSRYALIPLAWLLAYRGQIIWTASGLETTVYEAILLCSVFFLLKGLRTFSFRAVFVAAFMLGLLSLTRPEGGALSCLLILIFGFFLWPSCHFKSLMTLVVGVWSFIFIPYLIWRLSYFGYLFPNPVYCKAHDLRFLGVLDRHYLALVWPFLCCTLSLLSVRQLRPLYLFLISPSFFYLILLSTADPVVAFDNRLFLPAWALILPLATIGIVHLFKERRWIYLFSFILLVFIPKMTLSQYHAYTINPIQGELLRMKLSTWLAVHARSDETVVLADSGLVPYLNPTLHFVDSYCLNNQKMAHDRSKNRYLSFCETIWKHSPDYIILTAWIHDGIVEYTPADACLKQKLDMKADYQLTQQMKYFDSNHTVYQYLLFTKK